MIDYLEIGDRYSGAMLILMDVLLNMWFLALKLYRLMWLQGSRALMLECRDFRHQGHIG